MSVSRSIEIRLLSNTECLSGLIGRLTTDFWNLRNEEGKYLSLSLEDNDDFDFREFDELEKVYQIIDDRERAGKINAVGLWDHEYYESFGLLIHPLENNYNGYNRHYLFSFTPDMARRIQGAPRLTDYGFYLNQLLPKLISIGSYICEVKCHDFDS